MKPTPPGWSRLSVSIFYDDASRAIDWLCRAFGFVLRLKVEGDGGEIVHSELTFGDAVIMVGGSGGGDRPEHAQMVSPRRTGGNVTACLALFVDDADAHCERARAAGAAIFREPVSNDYGGEYAMDRSYGARDPEGHIWFFMQRLRNPPGDGA